MVGDGTIWKDEQKSLDYEDWLHRHFQHWQCRPSQQMKRPKRKSGVERKGDLVDLIVCAFEAVVVASLAERRGEQEE